MANQFSTMQSAELDLEYRLSLVTSMMAGCNCSEYLLQRRGVVLPAVYEKAGKEGVDPIDIFVRFRNNLHEKLCKDLRRPELGQIFNGTLSPTSELIDLA